MQNSHRQANFESFKYSEGPKEKLKSNEMGEREPEMFYRNEYSQENTANHRTLDLELHLENQPETNGNNNQVFQQMEEERQRELDRLDLDYSSRNSNDGGEKPDIEVSFI
mmetsp:Transcript_24922/g.22111  ORF Transcript_24922/g.22111 Transcript_24922/m.22111 type:complete len:110 (+) Transcript_24922:351-680(+)